MSFRKFFAVILLGCIFMTLFSACRQPPESLSSYDTAADLLKKQFSEENADVVILHTSKGDIRIALFADAAPKAVENFLALAKKGYYDGLTFHRVINDFMIHGGDPLGNSTGGTSTWEKYFEDEFSPYYRNYRGALSMANTGPNTNGSQFFIVQNSDIGYDESRIEEVMLMIYQYEKYNELNHFLKTLQQQGKASDEDAARYSKMYENFTAIQTQGIPQEESELYKQIAEKYIELGGAFHLDYVHTVFGQVTEGMEVVDAIAAAETGTNDKPLEDVTIISIEIVNKEEK